MNDLKLLQVDIDKTIDIVRECGLLIDWGICKFSAKQFCIMSGIIL